MTPLLLQDYVTVRGASGQQIVQSAHGWIDLGEFEDLILYTDVREASGAPTMTVETAPARQDNAFVTLKSFTLAAGLRTDVVTAYLAKVPPAQFLRWRLSADPALPSDATFRIWVAGYGWTR